MEAQQKNGSYHNIEYMPENETNESDVEIKNKIIKEYEKDR